MRSLFLLVLITCSTDAQNNRIVQFPSYDNGHGWDIRLAVPGQPGNDYPTLSSIPRTRFTCAGKEPGYYADVETNCQVFRVCTVGATYGFQSFLCPNGTLFNQAVFVCDWWMNVICNKSDELGKNRNDQFENLKLGPQLMKDVKKMLTHPVRNPVNTNSMKSKVIVMQNYKPPSGQLFPNGALLTPPEKPPSHIYFPTKAIQTVLRQNDFRIANLAYSASPQNPQYIPPVYSTIKPTTVRNVEILQRQTLYDTKNHDEYTPIPVIQNEKIVSNGHTGQMLTQPRYSAINNLRNDQETRQKYIDLRNRHKTQNTEQIFRVNTHRDQQESQNGRLFGNLNEYSLHNSNGDSTVNINISNQSPPLFSTKIPTDNSRTQKGNEVLSSRVSSDIVPPTILAKTVAYSRLVQEPKQGPPKSRITFKTWVLKPTRNPKLLENSSPYIYNPPNNVERQIDGSEFKAPYYYNKQIESVTIEDDLQSDLEGYNYPNPTIPSYESNPGNQEISGLNFTPTTLDSLNELFMTTTTPRPVETPQVLLNPATIKTSARQYLPPIQTSPSVTNQYLQPNSALRKLSRHENLQLITEPTPSKIEDTTLNNDIKFNPSHNQQNNFEHNNNNLSFSDFLANEKLDITINEIVNDTNDILHLALPRNIYQYNENFESQFSISSDNSSENRPTNKESVAFSAADFKPAKLISIPSDQLQPPIEDFDKFQSDNKISNLPYIEKILPTIERTVSLKITIPERIANYLFKTHYDAKLEVLNTDSSNYLVLKHMQDKNLDDSFIPIGKLSWDGNSNLSTSQALVFSLVADSINTAKKYRNIIQDNVITPTPSTLNQFPAVSSEELGRISKTISKLTASQYTSKNLKSNNFNTKTYQSRNNETVSQDKNKEAFTSILHGNKNYSDHARVKSAQLTSQVSENTLFSKQNQNSLNNFNSVPQTNTKKIYSGQLYKYPVPEVTRQIINAPNPANSNIVIKSDFDKFKTQESVIKNTANKPSDVNANTKVIKTQSLPGKQSARLQVASSTERVQFNSEGSDVLVDNLINDGSGITAQLQDKITGTLLYPSDRNKFVSYKKDQSYYLQSELSNKGNVVQSRPNQQKIKQKIASKSYPDIITFHFISSDDQKQILNDASREELQRYRLSESNTFNEREASNIYHSNYPPDITDNTRKSADSQVTNQRQTVTRLYDGPSSYSAPQSSIGNLIFMERNENFKAKIEDLDENDNFNGYLKERPTLEFNF